jgi:hypothetical protein
MFANITSSIYGSRSYMKWRYGGVRHGALAGKRRDVAFGVLASLGLPSHARFFPSLCRSRKASCRFLNLSLLIIHGFSV